MDDIPYEPNAYYIFDRGYFDFSRLYHINIIGSNFVIREKGKLKYEIITGDDLLEAPDNVIFDQVIKLTGPQSKMKYPGKLRRVVFYSEEHKRTFTYLSNNFEIKSSQIALLYKQRWQVESSLSGSNNICISNHFGALLRMLYVSRFILQSLPIV